MRKILIMFLKKEKVRKEVSQKSFQNFFNRGPNRIKYKKFKRLKNLLGYNFFDNIYLTKNKLKNVENFISKELFSN